MQKDARSQPEASARRDKSLFGSTTAFYHSASARASTSFSRCKLPPYTKAAAAFLADHTGPMTAVDLRIFTGRDAWKQAGSRNKPTLCLPPGEDSARYTWALVKGCEPWVIETGNTPDSTLQRLALELLTAGALVVRMSFWDGSDRQMAIFRPGGEHG